MKSRVYCIWRVEEQEHTSTHLLCLLHLYLQSPGIEWQEGQGNVKPTNIYSIQFTAICLYSTKSSHGTWHNKVKTMYLACSVFHIHSSTWRREDILCCYPKNSCRWSLYVKQSSGPNILWYFAQNEICKMHLFSDERQCFCIQHCESWLSLWPCCCLCFFDTTSLQALFLSFHYTHPVFFLSLSLVRVKENSCSCEGKHLMWRHWLLLRDLVYLCWFFLELLLFPHFVMLQPSSKMEEYFLQNSTKNTL